VRRGRGQSLFFAFPQFVLRHLRVSEKALFTGGNDGEIVSIIYDSIATADVVFYTPIVRTLCFLFSQLKRMRMLMGAFSI